MKKHIQQVVIALFVAAISIVAPVYAQQQVKCTIIGRVIDEYG